LGTPTEGKKIIVIITATAVGLRLSDNANRVAVAHRLGSKACEPQVRQWMHVGCMDYSAAEALPDNNVTVI